jgi:hypothetical protein
VTTLVAKNGGDAGLHKDWELEERRLQHAIDNQELEDSFKNLYLDEDVSGPPSTSTSASGFVASAGN